MEFKVSEGNYKSLGVSEGTKGWIFTVESDKEEDTCLVLSDIKSQEEYRIDIPKTYCRGSIKSIEVWNLQIDRYCYYYVIDGSYRTDAYATAVHGREKWADYSRIDSGKRLTSRFADRDFDWENDSFPELGKSELIIYKLHVRGYTMDTKLKNKGTFAALTSKLSYIEKMGFTAVELMPVYEFEELTLPTAPKLPDYIKWKEGQDDIITHKQTDINKKLNFWGYGPGDYFAVKASYASRPMEAHLEFKKLVRALHERNMEIILEMQFPGSVNQNLILEVLRFWVREYHVDGFRLLGDRLPVTAIVQDLYLSRTKIFYNGFDESGASSRRKDNTLFIDKDEYMYPARKILNHMNGQMREFIDQQRKQGTDCGYVNYIATNNGFTLADLFAYNDRHNEANGENNTDGYKFNFSNNYGCEGPSQRKYIRQIRHLKWRNAMLMLFLGQGVPLIMAGDEFENSQNGNNNAYCQDNETGWVNWKSTSRQKKDMEFVSWLTAFRKKHRILSNPEPFKFNDYKSYGYPDLSYHGNNAWISESDTDRLCLGLMYSGDYGADLEPGQDEFLYIGYNFYSYSESLALPGLPDHKKWYLVFDSSDRDMEIKEQVVEGGSISMEAQAICILVGK